MKFDLGTVTTGLAVGSTIFAGLHTLNCYYHMEACTLCHPATWLAKKFLKTIRTEKFDKECLCVTALQKCGSTLLCYIVSLVNTENKIDKFRNDFDLLPMLSFPTSMIAQNFNQRQEGKYQLYKINGRLIDVEGDLDNKYHHIWLCRDVNGYFCSVYWWVLAFYPKCRDFYKAFRLIPFWFFKYMFFKKAARDQINEMFHVYTMRQSGTKFMYMVTYAELVENKEYQVKKFCKSMGITLSQSDIENICHKTSKKSMLEYDRFDPVSYGEGDGIGKVNLEPHKHKLNDEDMQWYNAEFKKKFAGTGITNYEEFSKWVNSINE